MSFPFPIGPPLLVVRLMIVDLVVPEERLQPLLVLVANRAYSAVTHLVSITPEEVLCPDIHVRVLCLLVERRLMRLVLPMLVPQAPCVDGGKDQCRDCDVDSQPPPEICGMLAATPFAALARVLPL